MSSASAAGEWLLTTSREGPQASMKTRCSLITYLINFKSCYLFISCVQPFCDPMACSPPGSSVHGISQARILEWVAISFSNPCMHAKSLQSDPTLCDPIDSSAPGSSVHGILQARVLQWGAIAFSDSSMRFLISLIWHRQIRT